MPFSDLTKKPRFLFDGGMGTMLQASGIETGECPELLNLTHPEAIAAIQRQYVEAGAMIVETNTLGANAIKLEKSGCQPQLEAINAAALAIIRDRLPAGTLAALSIGPTGDFLEPYGSLTLDALYAAYAAQIQSGRSADVFYIETQCDLAEARVAMLAAKGCGGTPYVASFTFENGRTLMGNPPEVCAYLTQALGASAVGVNCSGGPEELLPIVQAMRAATSLPLIVQPNAGLPQVVDGKTCFPFAPEPMAQRMQDILAAGADGIGGCCGTTPAHIAAMAHLIEGMPAPAHPAVAPQLTTKRSFLPLDQALSRPFTIRCAAGSDLYDLLDEAMEAQDEEAACLLLELGDMPPEEIASLLAEGQDMFKLPLVFSAPTAAQAEAALRAYHGVAALACAEDAAPIAAYYGAHWLGAHL